MLCQQLRMVMIVMGRACGRLCHGGAVDVSHCGRWILEAVRSWCGALWCETVLYSVVLYCIVLYCAVDGCQEVFQICFMTKRCMYYVIIVPKIIVYLF
jgi:hypothetical protein